MKTSTSSSTTCGTGVQRSVRESAAVFCLGTRRHFYQLFYDQRLEKSAPQYTAGFSLGLENHQRELDGVQTAFLGNLHVLG